MSASTAKVSTVRNSLEYKNAHFLAFPDFHKISLTANLSSIFSSAALISSAVLCLDPLLCVVVSSPHLPTFASFSHLVSLPTMPATITTVLGRVVESNINSRRFLLVSTGSDYVRRRIASLCIYDDERAVCAGPSHDVSFPIPRDMDIASYIACIVRRKNRFHGLLILAYGEMAGRRCFDVCGGHSPDELHFQECRVLAGFEGGACALCVWLMRGPECQHSRGMIANPILINNQDPTAPGGRLNPLPLDEDDDVVIEGASQGAVIQSVEDNSEEEWPGLSDHSDNGDDENRDLSGDRADNGDDENRNLSDSEDSDMIDPPVLPDGTV
jgi:hypothetical protein